MEVSRTLVAFPLAATLAACVVTTSTDTPGSGGPGNGTPGGSKKVALLVDTNRNGTLDENDPSETSAKATWDAAHGAIFLANIDDDQRKCPTTGSDDALAKCNDAADSVVNGPDDALDLAPMRILAWRDVPTTAVGTLSIDDKAASKVRLFRKVGADYQEFVPAQEALGATDLQEGVDLFVEGKDVVRDSAVWDGFVDFTLSVTDGSSILGTDTVRMRMAPIVTPSHLDEPIQLYASDGQASETDAFISDLSAVSSLKKLPHVVGLRTTDVWAQDYWEPAYMTMPASDGVHAIHVAYRSANFGSGWTGSKQASLRPGGRTVFTLRGKDFGVVVAYDPKHDESMDSLNSFGNLETIPPFSFGGKDYPLGRVLRGKTSTYYPDPVFVTLVESQAVQPPVYVDTSWLLVGHVDEVFSFIPSTSSRGWKLLLADPTAAKQMFTTLNSNGSGSTPLHVGKKWWGTRSNNPEISADTTVAKVLQDTDVMGESQQAASEIESMMVTIRAETGITDAEILSAPFLFHSNYQAGVAYQPGMVNGLSFGKGHFIAPKPFGPAVSGKDVFEQALEDALAPDGVTVHWVDDWDLLHRNDGEVHCGSNTRRALSATNFWTTGR